MSTIHSSTFASRFQAIANVLLPLAFFGGVIAVWASTDWNVSAGARNEMEMRPATTMPSLAMESLSAFPGKFYHFFGDNFGLRFWALNTRTKIWLRLLRFRPAPDTAFSTKVYLGQQDWLFYAGERVPLDILHADPISDSSLDNWVKRISERRVWLGAKGIDYLFVLVPDKRTIYPDRLPDYFRLQRTGSTRREQLMERLQDEPSFLDLAGAIRAATPSNQLYYRWDTHWNREGAYLAYRAMMSKLHLSPLPKDLGLSAVPEDHIGDLGRMIALTLVEHDKRPEASCSQPAAPAEIAIMGEFERGNDPAYRASVPTVCEGAAGRLIMFHDSFGKFWAPYLSSQFGFAAYSWHQPSIEEIKQAADILRPTVVIEERTERLLTGPIH